MNTPPGSYNGLNRSGSDISAVDSIHMLSRRATAGSSAAPSIIRSELGSISSNVEAKYSSIALINHVNGTDGGAPTVGNYRTKVWVVNTDDRKEDFPCELVVFIDKKDHVHVYFTGLGDAATATGMRTHSGYFICIKAREAAEPPSFNLMWMRDPFYAQAEAADVSINALFDSNSNKIRFDRDPRLVEHLLRVYYGGFQRMVHRPSTALSFTRPGMGGQAPKNHSLGPQCHLSGT